MLLSSALFFSSSFLAVCYFWHSPLKFASVSAELSLSSLSHFPSFSLSCFPVSPDDPRTPVHQLTFLPTRSSRSSKAFSHETSWTFKKAIIIIIAPITGMLLASQSYMKYWQVSACRSLTHALTLHIPTVFCFLLLCVSSLC